jgi:hypothetical protein
VDHENVPALADDTLIAVAKMAEARIDAVIKIKQLALKVTNPRDWTDQQGNPYLQVSGSEKVANLFNISWSFLTPEPLYEEDPDGHYTYTFKGRFSMGSRSIEVEGSRSSKDSFFKQNVYVNDVKREKTIDERDNKRDVKMAALTNMLGNGITRLLGIRNLTWDDLEKFAGIKKDQVGKVEYKKDGVKPPQEKGTATNGSAAGTPDPTLATEPQHRKIRALMTGLGYKKDDEHHNVASSFLNRKVESFNTLTKNEASQLIDHLEKTAKEQAQG